jgi:ubiquinone/menaquinone biosynthesis C-methylase UbiE
MDYHVDRQRIIENHARFLERQEIYKKRGLDHLAHRQWLLKEAGALHGGILEIGSGRGNTALALARAGYRFVSVDLDMEMLECTMLNLAHEGWLGQASLCLADATRLGFRDGSFGTLVAVDFFHHLVEFGEAIAEMDRVLAHGGRAIISDFNRRGRALVSSVHEEEGRTHTGNFIPPGEAERFFLERGYTVAEGEDACHWFFIADKREER